MKNERDQARRELAKTGYQGGKSRDYSSSSYPIDRKLVDRMTYYPSINNDGYCTECGRHHLAIIKKYDLSQYKSKQDMPDELLRELACQAGMYTFCYF